MGASFKSEMKTQVTVCGPRLCVCARDEGAEDCVARCFRESKCSKHLLQHCLYEPLCAHTHHLISLPVAKGTELQGGA
jgi:hypothetical protein